MFAYVSRKKKRMAAYILQLTLLDMERLEIIGIVLIYLVRIKSRRYRVEISRGPPW